MVVVCWELSKNPAARGEGEEEERKEGGPP